MAVSSATPNSSIRALPLSSTSIASVTTAPSTQPPETEPSKLPSASMTRWLPTGRGAEPQVCTTVAMATSLPAFTQLSAITSGSRASSRAALFSMIVSPKGNKELCGVFRTSVQPAARIGGARGILVQRGAQVRQRVEIVNGAELVDIRQHGAYAPRLRLETVETQQRIEPDQAPAGFLQALHLLGQAIDMVT